MRMIESFIYQLSWKEFEDGFYNSVIRYDSFRTVTTTGVSALSKAQLRELHRFLYEHGVPVSKDINPDEIAFACSVMRNRAMSKRR